MNFEEIIVELSHNCNLNCIMCGFGKDANPPDKNKFMSFEKYRAILYQIGNLTKNIRLNGRGESTIHPEFIHILDYTKKSFPHLNINLFSNLSFNEEKIINSIKKNSVQLFISIDSPDKEELSKIRKGADFNLIMKNIESVKHIRNRPFIVFTIQEANILRIADIGRFASVNGCHIIYNTVRRDQGIEDFVLAVKNNLSKIQRQFNEVLSIYKNSDLRCMIPDQISGVELSFKDAVQTHGTMNTCPALMNELCVLYDGVVTPCNMFNPYIYGNIFEQSLNDIWTDSYRLNFLRDYRGHYYCKNCANLGL